jgi:hypothetical protein
LANDPVEKLFSGYQIGLAPFATESVIVKITASTREAWCHVMITSSSGNKIEGGGSWQIKQQVRLESEKKS